AMGVVYEGYDPMIKRIVALKTIRADQLAGADAANVVARFRREAQAAGRLSHPNIVPIYEFGEDAGTWFIAMECIRGRELKQAFETNERFTTADIVRVMSQVLDALDYSHRQGVIHRDIKPANIFLLPGGVVKVADFGIAHIETSNLTQVGAVMGTPSYMSPEQIMGLPVDGRSDLFSAGVILYQFLTGERPFAGSATTTMQKVLKEDPLPPSSLNVQAPSGMDAVVRKALAKRPEDRFQTAREFADAVKAAVPGALVAGTEPTLVGDSAPTLIGTPAATLISAPAATLISTSAATPRANAAPSAPAAVAGPASPARKSQAAAIALAAAVAIVALGAAAWYFQQRHPVGTTASLPPPPAAQAQVAPAAPAARAASAAAAPGTMLISAVGLIDPSDPRFHGDKALQQSALRADSRSQLVEKALVMLLQTGSLEKHYDLLQDKLLSQSASFVPAVVRESEPQLGKDGLMSITTQGVVNIKAVQKSLNQMSRDERIDFIRASGNPKVALQVSVRDADAPDAVPQPSPVAENILKERIKSFGFRTWSEGGAAADAANKGADFLVQGEARVKKLSMRLPASGLTVSKYALTSWTVKCIDRETGEEIYYNTALPKGIGSWPSEEEALQAIGAKIADEFSREFFLQHASASGQKVTLTVEGMPNAAAEELLARELVGLPGVMTATVRPPANRRGYDLQLAGDGPVGDLVATGVLKPLNAQLGQACFSVRGVAGDQVSVAFDPRCADPAVLSRLETNPPAGLYGAPPGRQRTVVKDPGLLRKLTI
ncbi:MAG: serine/threonine-protein kinase, partial [Casimicrobiaceae bacterium]